jgi:hypothetical protein
MPLVQSAMRGGDSAAIAAEVRALIGEPMIGALVACYVIGIAIVRCVGAIAFFGVNAGVVTASAPETPHQPPG